MGLKSNENHPKRNRNRNRNRSSHSSWVFSVRVFLKKEIAIEVVLMSSARMPDKK